MLKILILNLILSRLGNRHQVVGENQAKRVQKQSKRRSKLRKLNGSQEERGMLGLPGERKSKKKKRRKNRQR